MMGYVSYVSVVWLTCLLSVLILAEVTKAEVVRLGKITNMVLFD